MRIFNFKFGLMARIHDLLGQYSSSGAAYSYSDTTPSLQTVIAENIAESTSAIVGAAVSSRGGGVAWFTEMSVIDSSTVKISSTSVAGSGNSSVTIQPFSGLTSSGSVVTRPNAIVKPLASSVYPKYIKWAYSVSEDTVESNKLLLQSGESVSVLLNSNNASDTNLIITDTTEPTYGGLDLCLGRLEKDAATGIITHVIDIRNTTAIPVVALSGDTSAVSMALGVWDRVGGVVYFSGMTRASASNTASIPGVSYSAGSTSFTVPAFSGVTQSGAIVDHSSSSLTFAVTGVAPWYITYNHVTKTIATYTALPTTALANKDLLYLGMIADTSSPSSTMTVPINNTMMIKIS